MPNGNDDLIHPFRIQGPGQCPQCGNELIIHSNEIITLQLNKSGIPTSIYDTVNRCVGKCINCGTQIDMILEGLVYKPLAASTLRRLEENKNKSIKEILKENPFAK